MVWAQAGAVRALVSLAATSALLGGVGVGAFVVRDEAFNQDSAVFDTDDYDSQPGGKTADVEAAKLVAAWRSRRQGPEESGSGDDDSGSGDTVSTGVPTAAPFEPSAERIDITFEADYAVLASNQSLARQFRELVALGVTNVTSLTLGQIDRVVLLEGSIIAGVFVADDVPVDQLAAAAQNLSSVGALDFLGFSSVGAAFVTPTATPTAAPTATPTPSPTISPTPSPTISPTATPTTREPTSPTGSPTMLPTMQMEFCTNSTRRAADDTSTARAGAQQVTLCWQTPSGVNANWYRVVWKLKLWVPRQSYNTDIQGATDPGYGDIVRPAPHDDALSTEYTVRGLLPNIEYDFYIIAELGQEATTQPAQATVMQIAARAASAASGGSTADGYGSVISTTATTLPHDPAVGVIRLRTAAVTPSSITVVWETPPADTNNGIVSRYRLTWSLRRRRFADDTAVQSTATETYDDAICDVRSACSVTIPDLTSATEYSITIAISNHDRQGFVMPISTTEWTKPSSPSAAPQFSTIGGGNRCEVSSASPTGATVRWIAPSPSTVNGIITQYKLEVHFAGNGSEATTLTTEPIPNTNGYSADLEGQLAPSTDYLLRVAARTGYDADGNTCNNCWGPSSTSCMFTTEDADPETENPDAAAASADEGGGAGGVVAVIFIIVILAAAIGWVYWRTREDLPLNPFQKKTSAPAKPANGGTKVHETTFGIGNGGVGSDRGLKIPPPPVLPPVQTHPVNVDDLANTIVQMSANSDFAFSEEYECLETGNEFSREAAQLYENKMKNRYANILAYDYTRVRLTLMPDDPFSDYINANYIDGHGEVHKRKYIAAQGPTAMTVIDFWRMLYETDSNVVIMVTNCEEKGRIKCHRYWPTALNEEMPLLDNFSVVLEHVEEYPDFVIRKVRVKFEGVQRIMHQFHYTSWPDHGVPESTAGILMMLRKARAKKGPGPMAVHCSAGVGRTGTLIAIDHNIDRADAVGNVDVFQCLNMMRRQRNTMVQTEEQYIFIYRALLDSLSSVNTEMTEAELRVHFGELHMSTADGTNLDTEFKKLGDIQASNNYRTDSAQVPANKAKNRFQNIMPFEHTRLKLTPLPGVVGSDYMNASLIDGHKQRGAYIATQGPLEETSKDFWRMVWEQESIVIVMLTQLTENGRAKSDQYWPDRDEGSVTFGDYQVSLDMVSPTAYGFERMFTVTELVSETSRTVKQCQFTKWPGPNEQQDGGPMVKMCRAVKMYQDSKVVVPQMEESIYGNASAINEQSRLKQTKPIVVHCSAGVGRTGAFCAFHINLKKLEEDNKVDVFSTVKHLRTQRMSMVQTPDQYEYIYRVLLDMMDAGTEQFSDGNNLYENVPKQTFSMNTYSAEDAVAMQDLLPDVLPTLPPKLPQRPAAVAVAAAPASPARSPLSEEALLDSIISPNPHYEEMSIDDMTGIDAPAMAAAREPSDFEEAQFSGFDNDGPSLPPKSAAASNMTYEVVADGFSV